VEDTAAKLARAFCIRGTAQLERSACPVGDQSAQAAFLGRVEPAQALAYGFHRDAYGTKEIGLLQTGRRNPRRQEENQVGMDSRHNCLSVDH